MGATNGRGFVMINPEKQRRFAADIVRQLRDAGFETYWAGGCVRDRLLGIAPKDYDVATAATPDEIRRLFGRRRTLAIGAAFGVITVLGPKEAGPVEVATFRRDAQYSDGRHPDSVTFSSAEEDASRRDFTINGLFYDPIEEKVIDFVGGQEDLRRRVIRAIGQPRERIAEDRLRMLRAVRFAAGLDFEIDAETFRAVCEMAPGITAVSAERIAAEMSRMLVDEHRARAVRIIVETELAANVLPEIVPEDDAGRKRLENATAMLDRLVAPGFPLALAVLLYDAVDPAGALHVCRRWRLSNRQTDRVVWLIEQREALAGARALPWSALQPILIADGIDDLIALHEVISAADPEDLSHCRTCLTQPREQLDPPPLLTGDDLLAHGIPAGPQYRVLLNRVRAAQLDEQIHTRAEALELAAKEW